MPKSPEQEDGWERWRVPFYVAFGVLAWTVVASLTQGGLSMLGAAGLLALKISLVAFLLVAMIDPFRTGAVHGFATIAVLLSICWINYAGTFSNWTNLTTDFAGATFSFLLTSGLFRWLTRRRDPLANSWKKVAPKHLVNLDTLVWALLAWNFISAISVWRSAPLDTDPSRFAKIGLVRPMFPGSAQRWANLRIGLALSGGGYRAAVFHAGVLQGLEDFGIRVSNLTTVSGGSMIGAFYAVGGNPKNFVEAIAEGRLDLKRQLMLAHNAIRLLPPLRVPGAGVRLLPLGEFSRLDVQREMVQRVLLSGSPLKGGLATAEPSVGAPRLMIAVSDLSRKYQVGLFPDGMLRLGDASQEVFRGDAYRDRQWMSLAQRVAISGAFPIAFPPQPWKVWYREPGKGTGTREFLLADGGLHDNTGRELLRTADTLADPSGPSDYKMSGDWKLDVLLSSDGGAVPGVIDRNASPSDLLFGAFDLAAVDSNKKPDEWLDLCSSAAEHPVVFSAAGQFRDHEKPLDGDDLSSSDLVFLREGSPAFAPWFYPDELLRRIIESLPPDDRNDAKKSGETFLKARGPERIHDRSWPRDLHRAFDLKLCNESSVKSSGLLPRPGVCEALALREIVTKVVTADLGVFQGAATLDDRLSEDAVTSLDRLGKILVYLQWPVLERELKRAESCKARPATAVNTTPTSGNPPLQPAPRSEGRR